jgi:4-hydroxy-tetrahydrodipicolinate reductase
MKKTVPLNLALIGASGRLGQEIAALCPPKALFTRAFPARSDPAVDLYIDVSTKEALTHNLSIALQSKKPIVVGTTGHSDLSPLLEAARCIPIFYTPNFSLGMALMKKLGLLLASQFDDAADIDLIEAHHNQKKDAPSGSALLLARSIEERHGSCVRIHSLRSGHIVGAHTLLFNTPEEKLTLSHEAHSRRAFAKGALKAALFLLAQPPGLYGMDELLAQKITIER